MTEVRDRGVLATEAGVAILQRALARTENDRGKCWTQIDLAAKAKVSDRTVRRFLKRESPVDIVTGEAICQALNVDFESVVEFVVSEPDKNGQKRTDPFNPFTAGSPVSANRFYGRKRTIADLKNRIGARSAQCINLVGLRRSGKTSMLRYVQAKPKLFFVVGQNPLIVNLDLQDQRYHSPIGMIEGLRVAIQAAMGEEPWRAEQNNDPFAIEDGLEVVRDRGFRLIVMLDELEAIGRRLEEFQDWGEDWRSKASAGLFALVIATGRSLGEVYGSLGLTSPFDNIFSKTMLGALEDLEWRLLVQDGLPRIDDTALSWIDDVAGGWAFYVQMAAEIIWKEGDLNEAGREFRYQTDDRFRALWKDLKPKEQGAVRMLVQTGNAIDIDKGMGDRLLRYGVLRKDGQLFSSVFGEWILENGGAV